MIDNEKISGTQLWIFIVLTVIGVGVFSLPGQTAESVGPDSWIVIILGGLIGLLDFFLICALIRRFPNETLVDIAVKVLGKYIAIPFLVLFWVYMLMVAAMTLRVFGEVVKMSILTRTPIEVILISLLVLVFILSRGGVEPLVRFDQVVFPIVISIIFFMVIFALPRSDFSNLLPFLRSNPVKIAEGTYQTVYSFGGFEFVLLIVPFIKKPGKIFKPGIISFSVIIGVYLAVVILSLAKFGADDVTKLTWPVLTMLRTIEIPGSFIERSEGVIMTAWTLFVFTSIAPLMFGLASLPSRLLKHNEFKHFCAVVLPIIYIVSLIPDNIVETYTYLDIVVTYLEAPSVFFIPILLFILSSVRKVGTGTSE